MNATVLARKVAEIHARALLPADLATFFAERVNAEALILNLYPPRPSADPNALLAPTQ